MGNDTYIGHSAYHCLKLKKKKKPSECALQLQSKIVSPIHVMGRG